MNPLKNTMGCVFALCIVAASAAHAQQSGTSVRMTVGAGLFTQPNGLGTRYGGVGSMKDAPVLTVGVQIQSPGHWYGFRFDAVTAITTGYNTAPASDCQVSCTASSVKEGRFWAVTGGVMATAHVARVPLEFDVGTGVRRYSFPGLVCACDPFPVDPAHVLLPLAWYHDETAATGRIGVSTGYLDGKTMIRFGIADYISSSSAPGIRHDLVVSLMLVLS